MVTSRGGDENIILDAKFANGNGARQFKQESEQCQALIHKHLIE